LGELTMHELSLAEALVELIEEEGRKHDCTRVRTVRLEIGAVSCVEPEAMRFCFDAVTRGTIAEGAALDIDIVPARGWCPDCAKAIAVSERLAGCPDCGNWRVQVTGGDDLRLKELEVE
jgi:hydrogenase nickel incorporation protein HypA/HybF